MIRTNPFQSSNSTYTKSSDFTPPSNPQNANTQISSPFPQKRTPQTSHQSINNQNPIRPKEKTEFELAKAEYDSTLKNYNSSTDFLRATTTVFPKSNTLLKNLSFPIGLLISPLYANGEEIPTLQYGEQIIPRCPNTNCRAYLNPFVKFIEGGDKWICNFCKQINFTERHYYADLDKNGERVDKNTKPELSHGTYEFITNSSYWKQGKTPNKAFFIFIIETSQSAIKNNFLPSVIESIRDVINNNSFYNSETVRCCFISYDSDVNFFTCPENSQQPQMLCVGDDQIFLPKGINNLIFDVNKDKDKILSILDMMQSGLVNMPSSCKDSTKIITALDAAYIIGKEIGGKIVLFSSSNAIPSIPIMKSGYDANKPKEQLVYSTMDNKQLGKKGIEFTNECISIDIFAAAEMQINTLTLNQLCEYTNGDFYFYKNFSYELHYKNIFNQIRRVLTRPVAWEGVLRTRFSSGYSISEYLTPVLITNKDLFVLPTGNSDQHYQIVLGLNDNKEKEDANRSSKDNFAYIQSALLYSYGDGQRKIRIHNMCILLSDNAKDIYDAIDSEALATLYLKATIDKIYKTKNINNAIISTETLFKTFISVVLSTQMQQRELSDNLLYLPMYVLGMIKQRIFCKDEIEKKYDIDLSNYLRLKLQRASIEETMSYIYPHIFPLNYLLDDNRLGMINENGIVNMPNILTSHSSSFESDGVYLIDNGYFLIIYVKSQANTRIVQSLFGVESPQFLTNIVNEEKVFKQMDEFKERVMNIIDYIRSAKDIFQNLIFVFEGNGTGKERIVLESLVEDNYCPWYKMDLYTFNERLLGGSGRNIYNKKY